MPISFWMVILAHEEALVDHLALKARERARNDYLTQILEGVKTTILDCVRENLCGTTPMKAIGGSEKLLPDNKGEAAQNTSVQKVIIEGKSYVADENGHPVSPMLTYDF